MLSALFLHYAGHLDAGGGGVQACSREYVTALERVGFDLTPIAIPYDRRIRARIRRKVWPDPYSSWFDVESAAKHIVKTSTTVPSHVFINQHSLGGLAAALRPHFPKSTQYVLLSHGLESTDYLHDLRAIGGPPPRNTSPLRAMMLGWRLIQEARQAQDFDYVFCLSGFERELEHWIGAERVTMIPRIVVPDPLPQRMTGNRLGFVGTIDHRPNQEGLVLFLDAWRASGFPGEIRVVGGPASLGNSLSREYPSVRYLGALSQDALAEEASTWSCFLHPIFCYARGASTKLATALAWELPIVTTTMGARGYVWTDGELPTADDPTAFATLAASMLDHRSAELARAETHRVARSSPTLDQVALLVRNALALT